VSGGEDGLLMLMRRNLEDVRKGSKFLKEKGEDAWEGNKKRGGGKIWTPT